MMSRRLLSVALLCILCASPEAFAKENPETLLNSVNTFSGVNREDADKIARAYFSAHVGCGVYEGLSESATAWIVEGKFGYAGQPIKKFIIDKRSGAM